MAHHFFVQGSLGAGKTLIASTLAHWWKLKVEREGGKIELFSNYELDDSTPMTHYTDWYKVAEAQGSICVWDECYTAFSNRNWNNYGQNILNDVMMLTRKMKSIQIYCSPSIGFVDTRLRSIVEVLITARKVGDAGFEYHFMDYQTKQFMHKQFLPMYKAKKIMKLGLYDTEQMVRHFPVPTNEREGNVFFETIEEIHDRSRGKRRITV
ncbi:zonular occludens toxin domain-containing protein [Cytobacillus gottheilii]|uniref:zonular occludens toxin domain-containing protein n=1 Tax=Cytobacillus gottheilii TaxID=859144 RepID=UPI000829F540|nr:zonular occludens toxin domain-containing protein [Cytobacillus gottheilii]